MTIITFRYTKESMLEHLTPAHRARAEDHIAYTLSILQQETMSAEAIATIISYTREPHDLHTTANG